jgi:DNA-binding FadR family transcriptional regulator
MDYQPNSRSADGANGNSHFAVAAEPLSPTAVLDKLRALIVSDALAASGRLPAERALADSIGVSRRALRQALDVLEAEGLVMRQQGRGTFLADARAGTHDLVLQLARVTNPVDTLEVRLAIEPPQARLAALRATRCDIDRLFELAEASRTAADPASYEKADAEFHRRIAIAARNPLMIAIFDAVLAVASDGGWRHGRETAHCINNHAAYAAAHRKIAEAIAERNPELAEERMRAHLSSVQQRLIEHAFPRPALAE